MLIGLLSELFPAMKADTAAQLLQIMQRLTNDARDAKDAIISTAESWVGNSSYGFPSVGHFMQSLQALMSTKMRHKRAESHYLSEDEKVYVEQYKGAVRARYKQEGN